MKKVILIDLIKNKEYNLPNKSEISIGRASENDIKLGSNKNGVSRKHCKIYRIEDKLAIMDTGSKNGTYFGTQRLPENKKYLLKDSYQFSLFNYHIKVKVLDEEELDKAGGSDTDYDFSKDL